MNDAEITILGGGPVGSALALLLARHAPDPSRIVLCHGGQARSPRSVTTPDPRALALNHGSRLLLEKLNAWPKRGAAIRTIHVSQRGRLGRTLIKHTDFGVPELGTVHTYVEVQSTLQKAVRASGVTLREGVAKVVRQSTQAAEVAQADATWSSGIVVQAEGEPGKGSQRGIVQRQYDQHAILTTVRASRPAPEVAWERFTGDGPLALLPIRLGAASEPAEDFGCVLDTYALVWCCRPSQAEHLQALDNEAFSHALNEAFGLRLGRLHPVAPRSVFPLHMRWRQQTVDRRRVVIGNAAQTLHPVAGQGLNLGLRDAALLAQTLANWLTRPGDDPATWLNRFSRARQADRVITAAITDFLPRIFATGMVPIEHAAGSALLMLDLAPSLRRPLARQLMHGLRI